MQSRLPLPPSFPSRGYLYQARCTPSTRFFLRSPGRVCGPAQALGGVTLELKGPPPHQVPDVATHMRGELEIPADAIAWVPSAAGAPRSLRCGAAHQNQCPQPDAPRAPAAKDEDFFIKPTPRELPTNSSERLPLELFDSPDFEPVPPEQLILRPDGTPGAGARSRFFLQSGEFTWRRCAVHGYDGASGLFTITWEGGGGSGKQVKRLNLIFDSDDPARFELRLHAALAWQAAAEAGQRFRRAAAAVELADHSLVHLAGGKIEAG